MGRRPSRPPRVRNAGNRGSELDTLLYPEAVFSDPFEVVADSGLSLGEKRAILARWLARICANDAAFGLKWMPVSCCETTGFDEVMDALRAVEQEGHKSCPPRGSETSLIAQRKPQRSAGTLH